MLNTVARDVTEGLAEEAGDTLDSVKVAYLIIHRVSDSVSTALEFFLRFYCFFFSTVLEVFIYGVFLPERINN